MKKILLVCLVVFAAAASAQKTFNPGVRAGLNFARLTEGDSNGSMYNYGYPYYNTSVDMKSRVDAYVGFQANLRFAKMYALQPEINYSRQGTKISYNYNNVNYNEDWTISYIGVAVVNKLYMNQFNIHLGPTLEIQTEEKNVDTDTEVDMGALIGVGYDITPNIGIEARIKKGFIPVVYGDGNHTNVVFQTGLYYSF